MSLFAKDHKYVNCSVCRERIGACHDPDVGDVCGDCKKQLILMEFNLRDVALFKQIEGCRPEQQETNR